MTVLTCLLACLLACPPSSYSITTNMCRSNNCPALTGATHILSTLVNTLYPPNPSYQYNTPHPNYRPFPLPLFPLTPLSLPPMNNRYMLGKLTSTPPPTHPLPPPYPSYHRLSPLPPLPPSPLSINLSLLRYMLGKLTSTVKEVESAYDEYQFYRANQALFSFANTDLSGT